MTKFIKRVSKKVGLSPGTMVHVGKRITGKVKIELFDYTEFKFQEKIIKKVEECFPFKKHPSVTWIDVRGLHEIDVISSLGRHFDIHPLVLEDIVNTNQRPKIEDFEKYIFIVLKMLYYDKELNSEQISLITGSNFVISFQEKEGDVFNTVRDRIKGRGRIRKLGSDYLAYSLIDSIVDNYFIILEIIGDQVENLEEELLDNPGPETLSKIHKLKRELILMRRSVWPLRDVINSLLRTESKLIKKQTEIYLRDLYDHTIQIIDTLETLRDVVSGMIDVYLSSISNKMNEVMKVLTMIATVFIPLTFIAGIYGMNFRYMPELGWEWSYPLVWVIMIIIAVFMFIYFRRKEWV
jgi:magnesium transporter